MQIRFKSGNAMPANEVIQQFMILGQILEFREVLPSINDIFIKLVKEESK